MAKQNPKFKLYLSNGDATKTITESHPKVGDIPTEKVFSDLGDQFEVVYNMDLSEATVQSETTVFADN